MSDPFLQSGWNPIEGPYPQFGLICRAPFRWAGQGASVKLPLAPQADNRITLRADPPDTPGQRLVLKLDGEPLADWPRNDRLEYTTVIPARVVGDRRWATLSFHNTHPVRYDARDTAVAVQWIEVRSAASRQHPMIEIASAVLPRENVDTAPKRWRYRFDPVDCGELTTPSAFWRLQKDDSGWDVVDMRFQPPLQRGDVGWFRTVVVRTDRARPLPAVVPPGRWRDSDDLRAWINGEPVSGQGIELFRRVARKLSPGANLVVYRVLKGPQPRVQGRPFTQHPEYLGRWNGRSVWISPGTLQMADTRSRWVQVELVASDGRCLSRARQAVLGKIADFSQRWFSMPRFGQYWLVLRDDRGRWARYPVYHLGIHHFHWGWYSAHSGTVWNGFQPCSNDYIDQLLGRLTDWRLPHHSITWQGCILAPGTGFHRTQGKDYIRAFREAIQSGQLQFVGSTWQPRNICTEFGESLVRSLRWSRRVYQSQLRTQPHVFCSHDSTLTPQQPQILRLTGYDSLLTIDNWWGQGQSVPAGNDLTWRGTDGSSIRTADSWYHGSRPLAQAERAIRCGKPAVLCHEEFACLDATVFLEASDREAMVKRGILVTPVTLDEYLKLTDGHAKARVYTGTDNLCHKGWTGGGPEEVEYEKINRLLESRLVALDNLIAWATYRGLKELPDTSRRWDLSMRWHECHNHWGNGYPDLTREMDRMLQQTEQDLKQLAERLAHDGSLRNDGICLANPNGFATGGPVSVQAPRWARSLRLPDGRRAPVQHGKSHCVVALPPLDALSVCGARWSVQEADGVSGRRLPGGRYELRNRQIRVVVMPNGRFSVYDRKTGQVALGDAGAVWAGRPRGVSPAEPFTRPDNPLNLNAYIAAEARTGAKLVEAGPARASVQCQLYWPGHDAVSACVQMTLCADEPMVRISLQIDPKSPWDCAPASTVHIYPHEGTYAPSLFVQFPTPKPFKPEADMAYCVSKGVLPSTNHETFLDAPFRWSTFNALAMAAPQGGRFVVLTRGLHDFMAIDRPTSWLGLSLAVTTGGCTINRSVRHEYAVLVRQAQSGIQDAEAYTAAQAFLSPPIAVQALRRATGTSVFRMPSITAGPQVMVTGMDVDGRTLRMRVLNASAAMSRCAPEAGSPWVQGVVSHGRYQGTLPPWALREWCVSLAEHSERTGR